MTEEETYDELINQAIDKAIQRSESNDEELKKRRPKPFRYLTDKEEIKEALSISNQKTVMKSPDQPKIIDNQWQILGLGDMETVENVIRKHIISRQFREK